MSCACLVCVCLTSTCQQHVLKKAPLAVSLAFLPFIHTSHALLGVFVCPTVAVNPFWTGGPFLAQNRSEAIATRILGVWMRSAQILKACNVYFNNIISSTCLELV